jgi:hypothetical protein
MQKRKAASPKSTISKRTRANIQLPLLPLSPLSPLSPAHGSLKTIPSLKNEMSVETNISNFNQIEMANKLKTMFMLVNSDYNFDLFFKLTETKIDLINKFDLAYYNYNKALLFPTTIINIMSRLNNLQIANLDINSKQPDLYKGYGSSRTQNYVLTIFDTIGVKVLYLINSKGFLYLSPLNIRNARDIIRKRTSSTTDLDSLPFINKNNRDLRKKFNITINSNETNIDASSYDIIMITEGFHVFLQNKNNIVVKLNNFDNKRDYKSSILINNKLNQKKEGHIISVNKCYNYTLVNTTWKPFYTYNINFVPGAKCFYYINDVDKSLNETTSKIIQENNLEYYYSHFTDKMTIYLALENIHLFSNSPNISRTLQGGSMRIAHSKAIPEVSVCSDIYFPTNLYGYCWFSSIINSIFYADDIAVVFLNRTVKNMDKTLEYVKNFYVSGYQTFDINNKEALKEFTKYLINLFTYIYCSFSILSKNQLHKIQHKIKWLEAYNKITNEYYDYIFVYIIVLSKTMKIFQTRRTF